MTAPRLALLLLAASLGATGCKVPLTDVNAAFSLADAAWFAEEETLFVFYELAAEQGLGAESLVEIRYTTDDGEVPWTELSTLTQVHAHVATECGFDTRCGSGSLHVPQEPRDVALRLRYHRDGELSLGSDTVLNIVGPGPPHTHRSLVVYGVFDARNTAVQWRARHSFPTVRNEDAERLGLRRRFSVGATRYGPDELDSKDNPYLYGADCPATFTALPAAVHETDERAVFEPADLPDATSDAATVCGDATVHDATGPFVTTAVARKNPEVRPAFPVLRSPVEDATPINYLLTVCDRTISSGHESMQRQRLLLGDLDPICIDDWTADALADELVARFRDDIERVRAEGDDMVLVIGVHHDTPTIGAAIEAALATALDTEQYRSTPRVAGAFVLDSYGYTIADASVAGVTMWCPANIPDIEEDPTAVGNPASLVCTVLPDNPNLSFGPFDIGVLPIFPTRAVYEDFVDLYTDAQAGEMKSLRFRVPELPAGADHVPLPPFAVVSFLNGEVITADADDAFSYCETDEFDGFVFRTASQPIPLPIESLPSTHSTGCGQPPPVGCGPDGLSRLVPDGTGFCATVNDVAQCIYGTEAEPCTDGEVCLDGGCVEPGPDVCDPNPCAEAPAPSCGDGTTLLEFEGPGVCTGVDGRPSCAYGSTEVPCGEGQACLEGRCLDLTGEAFDPTACDALRPAGDGEATYELGIVWDFPYVLRIEYEVVAAIAVTAFSATLPFGIAGETQADYGSQLWLSEAFPMAETLAQCRRFCDHPTFDSAGVYQVSAAFREAYAATCYRPAFPERGDSGFPDDP